MEQGTPQHASRREAVSQEFRFLPRDEPKEHRARIVLDTNGTVKHVTKSARRLLGYYSSQRIESCFFKLIHEQQQTRIMWDLAEMVGRHRQRAEWLVQMKTGHGAWRWFHIRAHNQLHHSGKSGIVLEITPCGAAHRP